MSNPYFFLKKENIINGAVSLYGREFKHLVKVLRAKIGDIVELSDNEGMRYTTSITEIKKDKVILEVKGCFGVEKNIPSIFLYQCLLKKESMELAIQKTVEIGIDAIIPVFSARVVSEPAEEKLKNKIDRWQQIANQAAIQSKRSYMTSVLPPERIGSIRIEDFDVFFMPVENLKQDTLFKDNPLKAASKIAYIIGPEGGFEQQEKNLLISKGALPVSFGSNILRSETASIYFLSIIDYILKSFKIIKYSNIK